MTVHHLLRHLQPFRSISDDVIRDEAGEQILMNQLIEEKGGVEGGGGERDEKRGEERRRKKKGPYGGFEAVLIGFEANFSIFDHQTRHSRGQEVANYSHQSISLVL